MKPDASLNSSSIAYRKYLSTQKHYFQNAQKFMRLKKFQKASELLWGVVAQTIKAHAMLLTNKRLSAHVKLRDYIRELAREKNDPELLKDYTLLENLHRNFYDEEIEHQDFPSYYGTVLSFLEKMERYSVVKTSSV